MTKRQQNRIRIWFEQYINSFRDDKNVLLPALELKYQHSLRVAQNARQIGFGINLAEAEVLLAEICGLVHDIGRFQQYERYGSFRDEDTMDHGLAGRRTLESEGAQTLFGESDWERVSCAVEFHNRRTEDLPAKLPGGSRRLLNIIRDADKLDIMEIVLQSFARDGFRDLYDMLPHIRTGRELTPSVLEELQKTKSISMGGLRTVTDFLVMLASWLSDFNFSLSRQIAVSRNLIDRLQKELPDVQSIRELLVDIKRCDSA